MINENIADFAYLQSPFFFSLLSPISFFSKSFFLFPALILLFVVPHQIWYQSMAFNCSYN